MSRYYLALELNELFVLNECPWTSLLKKMRMNCPSKFKMKTRQLSRDFCHTSVSIVNRVPQYDGLRMVLLLLLHLQKNGGLLLYVVCPIKFALVSELGQVSREYVGPVAAVEVTNLAASVFRTCRR